MEQSPQTQQKMSRSQRLNLALEDKQNRSYFVGAASVLFFLVFIVFGLFPAFGNVLSGHSENNKIKEAIKDITIRRDTLLAMKDEKLLKENTLLAFDAAFPDDDNQGNIVDLLYSISNYQEGDPDSQDMIIRQVTFLDQIRKTPLQADYKVGLNVKSRELTLVAEGNLAALQQFIAGIENAPRVMNIRRSVINKKTGEVSNQAELNRQYVLNLTIEYFYWGLPVEAL